MKRSLIAVALVLSTGVAGAEDFCKELSILAGQVMESRQLGIPLTRAVETLGPSFEPLALMAYEQPRYNAEKLQKRTQSDFSDRVYLECRRVNR